jgi:hypothetical protein
MKKLIPAIAIGALLLSACHSNSSPDADKTTSADRTGDSTTATASKPLAEKDGIKLAYFMNGPDFPDATLGYKGPDVSKPFKEGKNLFHYEVKNFELSKPTPGAENCNCNVSDKGQHIHHILNNEPYIAHYTDTFTQDLKPGHYINLAFLSRSYHESVKNGKAYQLNQFNVGGSKEKDVDLSKPLLFYSRPKGEYKGKDTKNVLLDFFLVNTDLSESGNKVRATINGKTEFMLTKWTGYSLSGLPMGDNTIKLELVDKDGKLIPGPYNSVERKITLKE